VPRRAHLIAFTHAATLVKKHSAHRVRFEVHRYPQRAPRELQQILRPHVAQTTQAHDRVANLRDNANRLHHRFVHVLGDPSLEAPPYVRLFV